MNGEVSSLYFSLFVVHQESKLRANVSSPVVNRLCAIGNSEESSWLAVGEDGGTKDCTLVQTFKVRIIDVKGVVLKGLSFEDISCHVDQAAPKAELWVEDV